MDGIHGHVYSLTYWASMRNAVSFPTCRPNRHPANPLLRRAQVPDNPDNNQGTAPVAHEIPPPARPASPTPASSAPSDATWLRPFQPRRFLSNGHLQTIVGNFYPRPRFTVPAQEETVLVDPLDGSRVLCHLNWQPEALRAGRLTVVLIHGLEGSSDSGYIRGIAARAWDAGWNVVRMNMRNCGDTEHLTPTLYHSGLSNDVRAVVQHFTRQFDLQRVALVGYSMGGNLALKFAGEWGRQAPLVAVATVCPAIDLAAGSDALHEPKNRLYEKRFLRGLMRRFRRKAALFPAIYGDPAAVGPIGSLRDFDHNIVARFCSFRDADDYYFRAASARVVDRVAVPALVLQAIDDPFIRLFPDTRAKILANPAIEFVETAHGGHCAYLSRDPGEEVHWAEATVIRWLQALTSRMSEP